MTYRVEIWHDRKWQLAQTPLNDWDIAGNVVRSWFAKGFKVRVIVKGRGQ